MEDDLRLAARQVLTARSGSAAEFEAMVLLERVVYRSSTSDSPLRAAAKRVLEAMPRSDEKREARYAMSESLGAVRS